MKWSSGGRLARALLYLIVALGVCAVSVGFFVFAPTTVRHLDARLYDAVLRTTAKEDALSDSGVCIIDIDEKSLAALGAWPWPRYRLAQLADAAKTGGAAGMAFDILLSEDDPLSAIALEKRLRHDFAPDLHIAVPEALQDNDRYLADIVRHTPLTLAAFVGDEQAQLPPLVPHPAMTVPFVLVGTAENANPLAHIPTISQAIVPIAPLLEAGAQGAFVNVLLDDDGIIRRLPMLYRQENMLYPSFSLRLLLQAMNQDTLVLYFDEQGLYSLGIGMLIIPVTAQGVFRPWFRNAMPFPRVSAVDVLNGTMASEVFLDKLILVGSSAAGIKDIKPTPLQALTAGVDIHAAVLDNILRTAYLTRPEWEESAQLAVMVALAVFVATACAFLPVMVTLLLLPLSLWVFWQTVLLLVAHGIYISALPPALTLLLCTLVVIAVHVMYESRQKKFLKDAFSRYIAPEMVKKMLENPHNVSLHGEERHMSIFFMDIRGFTALSKRLSPNAVCLLLNEYFAPITQSIRQHKGTVDKFIGDACMAFWNAPLVVQYHEKQALQACLHILHTIESMNNCGTGFQGEKLGVGIGLHAGVVQVGNMGTKELFNYTCIGDAVNVTSRLEGLCAHYGVSLLVTDAIRKACCGAETGDSILWSFENHTMVWLDHVSLKGHPDIFSIYTNLKFLDLTPQQQKIYIVAAQHNKGKNYFKAASLYQMLKKSFVAPKYLDILIQKCTANATSQERAS